MKQKLLKTWLMLVCLLVGVGTAWAVSTIEVNTTNSDVTGNKSHKVSGTSSGFRPANEIFYESFDTNKGTGGNDDQWSGSIASSTISQDNEGWVFVKGNGANQCAKFGTGSALGSATTPALGQACNATLTFKAGAWNGNSESTTLKLSVEGGGSVSPATVTLTKGAWNTFTATLTGLTASSKIKFEGDKASSSRFFLDEVSVVMTGEATSEKTLSSIAVKTAPSKVNYEEGDKFNPAGLVITATYSDNNTEEIAYASKGSEFTFTPSLTTALTSAHTSVTISYGGKTTTQAISVQAFSIANTQETAYTVAEAIAKIDAGKGLGTAVYVKGIVSSIVTAFNASYGNISVNISADGETTGAQFQLYRNFKGADKAKWTSATEAPEVGDEVIAYGTLIKYNSTYEMAEGNYLVSIVKNTPVVPDVTLTSITVSGTPTQKDYNAGDAFNPAGLVVTGTYSDNTEKTITEGITWTVDPKTLSLGTTSVSVVAAVGELKSNTFTVEGLTVTESLYTTATINSFSATSGNINADIAYQAYKGTGTADPIISNNVLRLYQNGGYVTITAATGLKIASVKITTGSTYPSTIIGYCVDDEDAPLIGEEVAKETSYTISGLNNRSVSIYCLGTDKNSRLDIKSIEVKYIGNAVTELKSIALSGNYPTEFTQGDSFSSEGLVVTATYTDETTKDVTNKVDISGYNMDLAGSQEVTVKYSEDGIVKTATYTITVARKMFAIEDGYEAVDFTKLAPYNTLLTNQSVNVADYDGMSFSMTFAKPQSSSNPTKYYQSGNAVRAYKGNTITITAIEPIYNVDIAWVAGYVDDAVTITGLGTKTAVITFSKTCRFTEITVYYQQYTRSLANEWGTICLPYNFKADENVEFYDILSAQFDSNGNPVSMALKLVASQELEQGHPYIFCADDVTKGLTCVRSGKTLATEPATVNGMTGSFVKHAIEAGMYLLSGNKFVKCAAGSNVGENRAYIDMKAVPTSSSVKADVIFHLNGEITDGIFAVENHESRTQYVDLSGRRVTNPIKGLYIVNGKKVMVK